MTSGPDQPNPLLSIVEFLLDARTGTSINESAIAAATVFLEDSVAVGVSGSRLDESQQLIDTVRQWGRGDEAGLFNRTTRLPPASAALVNGFQIHNQEWDCVHEPAVVHPCAVIVAALLAVAEARSAPTGGYRFLQAMVLAIEVATALGEACDGPIRFFRPAQCGAFGAVAGLGVLTELTRSQYLNAFGMVYSQLSGTMQAHVEGKPTLPLQIGFNARAAVQSVMLAQTGFEAPHDILTGQAGYYQLFEHSDCLEATLATLGHRWRTTEVSHKPFPTGRAAHATLATLQELLCDQVETQQIQSITVAVPPLIRQLVDRPLIENLSPNYARLCLPYLVGTLLATGTVSVTDFDRASLRDPVRHKLAERLNIVADNNADPNALTPQRVTIMTGDGQVLERKVRTTLGSPGHPLTERQRDAKFTAACRSAATPLTDDQIGRLCRTVRDCQQLLDISSLIELTIPS